MWPAADCARDALLLGLSVVVCASGCQRESSAGTHDPASTPRALASVVVEEAHGAPSVSAQPEPGSARAELEHKRSPAAGNLAPPAASTPEPTHVYAKTRFVWVRPEPDAATQWIGFLWVGGSAELRRKKPYFGPGCGTWYAIKPRGFVCVDGTRATLDPNDAALVAMLPYAPQLATAWPHHYAESRGLKRFRSLPNAQRQQALLPNLPPTIFEDRDELGARSTVAFSRELSVDGRDWLLSADYMWVEKARVEPYPEVTFQGVKLNDALELPIAFFREADKSGFRKTQTANTTAFEPTGEPFARLSWVKLSGASERSGDDVFWETATPGIFVKASDAVIPTPLAITPWDSQVPHNGGTSRGNPAPPDGATSPAPPAGATNPAPRRRSWIEVSVWQGWLIAYEDAKPVFTTLISPGRGGTPVAGKTTLETSSTPTGSFSITGKFATATMEAPNEFIHSSVPWAQNFSGPYALHAAYWHNDWGKLKSGGCINLSPIDAKWLFEFSDPAVPPGWHGVRWLPWLGPATRLVVHR